MSDCKITRADRTRILEILDGLFDEMEAPMSGRTEQIDAMRKLTAELTALEYGWEHSHEVPPAYVEPRLQTYLQQHVQPAELAEHVAELRGKRKSAV